MLRGSRARVLALAGVLGTALAACGGGGGSSGGGGGGGGDAAAQVVIGTTDKVVSFDPARAYDQGSWTPMYNLYQGLLRIPPGGNKPEPDAAQSCDFTDKTTYVCKLQPGLKFSDGSPLTAEDVKFSFERVVKINDPSGPSTLLAPMKSVEATDDTTVTFTLKQPDATWPVILTTGAAFIVPSDAYPADSLQPTDKAIGSGPYMIAKYEAGQRLVLEPNPNYKGPAKRANDGAILTYYQQPSALKLAVEQGDVDVAYRSLSATDIADLRKEGDKGVRVVEGAGTEIRYLVFNLDKPPADKLAVRKAIAMTIDRQAIADNVYNGTVTPLYSMVPQGVEFATKNFADLYGAQPDVAKAKQTLEKAGVQTPLPITLWWTPSHYGASSADEFTEIKRQLDASGLFKVTLKSAEWEQYNQAATTDQYAMYQLGWFPDYPDPNDYAAPFFTNGCFCNNHYKNERMDKLVGQETSTTDPAKRRSAFAEIQKIAAQDIPTIPLWQGKQIAVVREGVQGVEKTFDPSFTFRMWLFSKST